MARARNIKPGFYKNEDLAECSVWARLIFPGLWMLADREGRMEDRPKRVKGELLPYDSVEVDPLLDELARFGFILRYEVDGQRYIQILKFAEHQTPHVREQASTIPAPEGMEQSTAKVVPSTSQGCDESSPRSPESLFSESLSTDTGFSESKPAARGDEYTEDFEQAWAMYPSRPGASKKESFKAWNARLKAGVTVDEMVAGVARYGIYVRAMKTDPQYIKQPATFFGPGEHYKADWTPSPRASPATAKNDRSGAAAAVFGSIETQSRGVIDVN